MIFVTGATGLLGNCIVRELRQRGESIRVLCRPGSEREPLAGLDVEIIQGDLGQPESLADAIVGCDQVIHCGAYIHLGWRNLELSRAINVEATRQLGLLCLKHAVRLVHVSTVDTLLGAFDRKQPISETSTQGVPLVRCPYVVSKTEAEQVIRDMVRESGLDAVIVNPGFMLGPYDWKPSSGRMMLEVNRMLVLAAPPGGCSACDARDVAMAIANALHRGRTGENYILGGENLPYAELWRKMLVVSGRKKRVRTLYAAVKLAGVAIDSFNSLFPVTEGDVNGASIRMGCLNHYYDSSKAVAELGYQRRDLDETLRDAWSWLSQQFIEPS